MADTKTAQVPLEKQYEKMAAVRKPFIDRAEKAASLTIPSLFPKEDLTENDELEQPWQGAGARGLGNISNKIILSLFPPNSPFFRREVEQRVKNELLAESGNEEEGKNLLSEIQVGLSRSEQIFVDDFEASNARPVMVEAAQQLTLAGNVLLREEPNGDVRLWRLNSYVVKRSPLGETRKIITKELIEYEDLPEAAQKALGTAATADEKSGKKDLTLYTIVKWDGKIKKWESWQEVKKVELPESRTKFSKSANPWNALWMFPRSGLSYGDGFINQHMADLITLDSLTESITGGSAASARLLVFTNPNGSVDPGDVANAENGAVLEGNPEDVGMLQTNKSPDLRVAKDWATEIERRLNFIFLLNSTVQRKGERVTAEEIRFVAEELENALGGVYSTLARDWQLPFVKYRIHRLKRQRKFPPVSEKSIKTTIITGLDALGRGADLNRFRGFIADVGNLATLKPEAVRYIGTEEAVNKMAVGHGVAGDPVIKSKDDVDQEIADEQEAAQRAALASEVGEKGVEAIAKVGETVATENLTNNQ